MNKILNKQRMVFILVIVSQFLLSILVFLNYSLDNPVIQIQKEIMYMLLVVFIIILNSVWIGLFLHDVYSKTKKVNLKVNTVLNNNLKDIYVFGEIGIIFFDEDREITWVNEFLERKNLNIIGQTLEEFNKEFVRLLEEKKERTQVEIGDDFYNAYIIKELKMIILKDETKYNNLLNKYKDEAPIIAMINLDNYSDVLAILDENKMSELEAKVRNEINEWAKDHRVVLRKVRNDAYVAFFQENAYQVLSKERFALVDNIRAIVVDDNNLTISLGIGRGISDFAKLSEMAASAVDVALSRGGDQVVVNNHGKNMEFYGGSGEARSKRHKVKVRVVSKSLSTLMQVSKKVYIMGHTIADFDAIGASIGLYSMGKYYNPDTRIVFEDKLVEMKVRSAFRQSFEKEEIDEMIISPEKAIKEIDEDTLLILVDVSNPVIAMSPKLVEKAERIAVIDHHRPGAKIISQVFTYQEPAASSASEMVIEIIRYSEQKVRITPEVATLMLTGILLDTNYYKNKTGTRTYEASMMLKEYGADNNQANEFLKEEFEEHQLKTKIMANSHTPYYGVIVCSAQDDDIVDRTYLAKVAQEILEVKGIKACFVISYINEGTVGISARSDGSINVQKIMEEMGGGGHFSAAATQIDSNSLEETKEELYSKLESYIGDNRIE